MTKKLYKRFNSTITGDLMGPYSMSKYYNRKREKLTTKNAIGFRATPITKRLIACSVGYHAATKSWINRFGGRRVYEVILYGAKQHRGFTTKWIGTSFKIVRKVK